MNHDELTRLEKVVTRVPFPSPAPGDPRERVRERAHDDPLPATLAEASQYAAKTLGETFGDEWRLGPLGR